jgi:hypothetical protein
LKRLERNKPGRGRKNRVGVSLETEYENKLNRLAISCGNMAPTTLAYLLITHCLDDPQMVAFLQAEYSTTEDYRVVVVRGPKGMTYEIINGVRV